MGGLSQICPPRPDLDVNQMTGKNPRYTAGLHQALLRPVRTTSTAIMSSRLLSVADLGQQLWLDNLTRHLLDSGELARLADEDGITGVTSNPAIFYNALKNDPTYQQALAELRPRITDAEARFEALALPDIRQACDLFQGVYMASGGTQGFVSFEVSPLLAHDAAGTAAAARRLWQAIDRPNAMIKIPATPAGLQAIEDTIYAGINVNVTLIFSNRQLQGVQAAHRRGLERRRAEGLALTGIASVASVFISRIDAAIDARLPADLQGKTAISSAKMAYAQWIDEIRSSFTPLAELGAQPQWLLWASTSAKNPAYRDVLYVEELIGPHTINTVPDTTLAAFRDHGEAEARLTDHWVEARQVLARVAAAGIDLDQLGDELQQAGLAQFDEAYAKLLALVA